MKTLRWASLGAGCALLFWAETSFAENDRCRVRVGHPRPAGCAPFSSRAVKPRPKAKRQAEKPPDPESEFAQALRAPKYEGSLRQSERLLIQELSDTERLLRRTPRGAPDRARIILRLAEGYAELERLAQLRRIRAQLRHAMETDEKR